MHGSHDPQRGAEGAPPPAQVCDEVTPLLEAFHDGTLPAASARAVADHLLDCAACHARLDALAEVYRLVRSAPVPAPGPELRQRLYARIAAAGERRAEPAQRAGRASLRLTSEDVMYDTEPHPVYPTTSARPPRKFTRWLSAAAAVAIVALLAGVFVALPHGGRHSQLGAGIPTATAGASTNGAGCAPGAIQAALPSHAFLMDLAMTSPTDGWAVGTTLAGSGDVRVEAPVQGMILRYSHCAWTQVSLDLPNVMLQSISMDSATDGWAVGGNAVTQSSVALHYSGGKWQTVTLAGTYQNTAYFDKVRMLSASEGWIIGNGTKNDHGLLSSSLLHYVNGVWTQVQAPAGMIDDVAPIGAGNAWITGTVSDVDKTSLLAHYAGGQWTTVGAPSGIEFGSLRALSASDIWASGEAYPGGNYWNGNGHPAIAHYDGSGWTLASLSGGIDRAGQFVVSFGAGEGWAYLMTKQSSVSDPNLTIGQVQYESGGQWRAIPWTYTDIGLISAWARVSSGEYWAVGRREIYQPNPNDTLGNTSAGVSHTVLLHFVNGAWSEYGG